jgi:hypothetical protein
VEVSAAREFIRTFGFEAALMAGRLTEELAEFNKRQAFVSAEHRPASFARASAQRGRTGPIFLSFQYHFKSGSYSYLPATRFPRGWPRPTPSWSRHRAIRGADIPSRLAEAASRRCGRSDERHRFSKAAVRRGSGKWLGRVESRRSTIARV